MAGPNDEGAVQAAGVMHEGASGRSLRVKLAGITLGLLLTFIWVLVVYSATTLSSVIEGEQEAEQLANARYLAAELDQKVNDRLGALVELAARIDRGRLGDAGYLQEFLEQHSLQIHFSGGMAVIGADGRAVADFPVAPGRRGTYYGDRGYFRQAVATRKPVVDKPILGRALRRPVLTMSAPVADADGGVRAVLTGIVDLTAPNFLGLYSDPRLMGGLEFFLVSVRDELVIAATDPQRVMQPLSAAGNRGFADRLRQGDTESFLADGGEGGETIYSRAPVRSAGWDLLLGAPAQAVLQPAMLLRNTLYGAAVVASLVALVVIVSLVRRMLAPLAAAANRLDAMSSGRAALEQLPEEGDEEIRRFLASFNRLSAHLGRQQEILRESEARFRHLFESSPVAYQSLDAEGRLADVNGKFCELLGYRQEAILGHSFAELWSPEERPVFPAMFDRFSRQDRVTHELRLRRKDGTSLTVILEGRIQRDEGGGFARMHCILTDISERKRAEEALRESEQRLNYAMAAIGEGLWDWTLTDDRVRHNVQWCRLLGLDDSCLEHRVGVSNALVHEEDRAGMMASFQQCLDGHGPYQSEHRLRRADGGYIWVVDRGEVVERDSQGGALRMVGSIADITARKTADEELDRYRHHLEDLVVRRTAELAAAKDAAQVANRAKTAFLANMSHEIRTPMNAIIGLTHVLEQGAVSGEQRDRLRKIAGAADHLLSIINDVLDLSKIDVGKLSLDQAPFTLAQVFEDVCNLVAERIQATGLRLRTELPPEVADMVVVGDAMRVAQVLVNFTSNAIKFTAHGSVVIAAEALETTPGDVLLLIEVRDTGIGIAPDRVDRLFQPFEQADQATTRQYGGTGLGLAISRRLVELMGGTVGVDSQPGTGSRFWFQIRLARGGPHQVVDRGRKVANGDSESLRQEHRGALLLLVEDDPLNQEVAMDLLGEAGLAVDVAGDGVQAVEMARQTAYDLIMMDVQMPVMDGLAATRLIRRLPGRDKTPILAMTANAFSEDRERCLAAGMSDHIGKPVLPAKLFSLLRKWLPALRLPESPEPPVHVAAASGGDDLREMLSRLAGANLDHGLKWASGDAGKYCGLLRKFSSVHGNDMHRLRDLLAAGDWAEARRLTHGIKGTAGMLGLHRLQAGAAELYVAIDGRRPAAEIERRIAAVDAVLVATIADIAALPAPS